MSSIQPLPFVRPSTMYSPEWGSEVIAYLRKPILPEYFRTYQLHGLVYQGTWVVANVMDSDGHKYNLFRQYKAFDTTMTVSSMVVPGLDSSPVQLYKPGELYIGRCSHELDIDQGCIEIKPYQANPKSFNIQVHPQHLLWRDADDRIALTFEALGPALEFYVPGRWEDDLYRSEPYAVAGQLNGKPVSGFGVMDTAWGPPGCDFTQSKIYQLLEEFWIIWMNAYEDGTTDCGIYLSGLDHFRAGYYNQNGQANVAHTSSLVVNNTADGFVRSAHLKMDGCEFEFMAEARVAQVASMVSWASGKVVNLQEKRSPIQSFSWFEFFPKAK